jgi:hypothetical protein
LDAGDQPGTRPGKDCNLGLAERSESDFPRLPQSEPYSRRTYLDARGTISSGVHSGFFAQHLLLGIGAG